MIHGKNFWLEYYRVYHVATLRSCAKRILEEKAEAHIKLEVIDELIGEKLNATDTSDGSSKTSV